MTDYTHWHVGMKVVCIAIEWPPHAAAVVAKGCRLPKPGRIYTIREIGIDEEDGNVYVRLCEIRNPRVTFAPWPAGEPRFGARRFRPLVTRPTDISVFTAMLTGAKEREPA